MDAQVKYNDDGEPYAMTVTGSEGMVSNFLMKGTTAVATSFSPRDDRDRVYAYQVTEAMEYVETLPFVQGCGYDRPDGDADE